LRRAKPTILQIQFRRAFGVAFSMLITVRRVGSSASLIKWLQSVRYRKLGRESRDQKPEIQRRFESVRPRKERRGFDLISEALPFGRLWYRQAHAAASYAKFYSRSQPGEVRVFDTAGAMIAADAWPGEFREVN
jgi:hypothetical protein